MFVEIEQMSNGYKILLQHPDGIREKFMFRRYHEAEKFLRDYFSFKSPEIKENEEWSKERHKEFRDASDS